MRIHLPAVSSAGMIRSAIWLTTFRYYHLQLSRVPDLIRTIIFLAYGARVRPYTYTINHCLQPIRDWMYFSNNTLDASIARNARVRARETLSQNI